MMEQMLLSVLLVRNTPSMSQQPSSRRMNSRKKLSFAFPSWMVSLQVTDLDHIHNFNP